MKNYEMSLEFNIEKRMVFGGKMIYIVSATFKGYKYIKYVISEDDIEETKDKIRKEVELDSKHVA